MMFIMKWFGGVALLFLLFVLAGFVYIGANTDKLGFDFGEPSAISKQIPNQITESTSSTSTSTVESNSKNDLCSNIDGYCMDRYTSLYSDGYNSCVQSMMYSCNPELKTQQWSKKSCDMTEQKLVEIRVKKSLIPASELQYPEWQSLAAKEYDLSQDMLYHCK